MAIFGFHLILTLLSATIFNKIQSYFGLCNYFVFKGLYYYLLESSLFNRSKQYKEQPKITKKTKGSSTSQTNNKISSTENEQQLNKDKDRLLRLPLNLNSLLGVPFFDSIIWTFNYSFFALIIFILSDLYNLLLPENKDLNASLIWTFCALILQINVLLNIAFEKLTVVELFPERNTLVCASGFLFLGSLIFNAFADQFLDIEITKGYIHFIDSLNDFIKTFGFLPLFSSLNAHSPLLFLIILAFLFSIILSAFFFPLLQFTSLYFDSIENNLEEKELFNKNDFLKRLFLHFSFLSPIGIFLLFLRPIVDQILETQIINYEQLKSLRLLLLFLILIAKINVSKTFLQTFLDKPKNIVNEYSFKNMKEEERQKKIANYASYACTAALQYYMPITIILSIGLLLKNFADISFYSLLPAQYFGKIEQKSLPILSKQDDQKSIILNILFSKELHEPLWTLALTNLIFGQIIICLFGVLMRKTMGGGRDGKR